MTNKAPVIQALKFINFIEAFMGDCADSVGEDDIFDFKELKANAEQAHADLQKWVDDITSIQADFKDEDPYTHKDGDIDKFYRSAALIDGKNECLADHLMKGVSYER